MAGVKIDTVRSGVQLLSGLLKRADENNDDNGKVSRADVKNFLEVHGDGASLDAALDRVYRYAVKKYDTANPTIAQLNKALADAVKAADRADGNKNDDLSAAERKSLATTWKAIVDFAADYKGMSVDDVATNSSAP